MKYLAYIIDSIRFILGVIIIIIAIPFLFMALITLSPKQKEDIMNNYKELTDFGKK